MGGHIRERIKEKTAQYLFLLLLDGLQDSIYTVEVLINSFSQTFIPGLCSIELSAILKLKANGATDEPL